MPRKLYKLTDGDRQIIELARKQNNPNIFLNYYMRTEESGTWYRPVTEEQVRQLVVPESVEIAKRWKVLYESLVMVWEWLGNPYFFGPKEDNPEEWEVLSEEAFEDRRERLVKCYRAVIDTSGELIFHYPHGAMMIDWQLRMYQSKHPLQVVPGGMGSGKTYAKVEGMLFDAVTLPGYRGLALAPNSDMAREFHAIILSIIEGSIFEERFVVGTNLRPRPTIIFGNDMIGQTTIECFPLMEGNQDNSRKLLTLTADEALIDQAEQMMDLDTVIRNVGSRFRGTVKGRPRKGQITLLANSADNPTLYDLYDQSLEEPDYIWAYSPGTFENTYLTVADLLRYEKQVGKDAESQRMFMRGQRPIGSGEHFSAQSIQRCRDQELDQIMERGLSAGLAGYEKQEAPRVGVHKWRLPYDSSRKYFVAADPGWGNPPKRNAAAIGVFDYTYFPQQPLRMAAFSWVFGHNSPSPWIAEYTDLVMEYKAIGMNGFDATGFQSGYERMTDIGVLLPTPISLTGAYKYTYLNICKRYFAEGLYALPTITHIFSQLSRYRIPDDNLNQDIVMMFLVASALAEPIYMISLSADEEPIPFDSETRYYRGSTDRYSRSIERR